MPGIYTRTADGLVPAIGAAGEDGADGVGVPAGGAAGQVLAKNSATDYDAEWVDASVGGGAVDSVNGQTGAVVLDAADVDAVEATGTVTKLHGPITQAAYDALTPAADTLYVIVG